MTSATQTPIRVLRTTHFEMSAHRIEAYADAIEDPNPRYRHKDRDRSHVVAPPGLAASYMQEPVRNMFTQQPEVLEELGIDGTRVVFGEITYTFLAPIRPGEWLTVTGVFVARRASGKREILTFATEATTDDGTVVTRAEMDFVRL
ncbi:MaoC family dehydratase [Streptomyces sp. WG-D5]